MSFRLLSFVAGGSMLVASLAAAAPFNVSGNTSLSGDTVFDAPSAWTTGNINLAGFTLTNSGTTWTVSGTALRNFNGGGRFINNGTVVHGDNHIDVFSGIEITNNGLWQLTATRSVPIKSGATFRNFGELTKTTSGDNNFGDFSDAAGVFVNETGGIISASAGNLILNEDLKMVTFKTGTVLNASGTGTVTLDTDIAWQGTITGSATGTGVVQLNPGSNLGIISIADDVTLNITGNGFHFAGPLNQTGGRFSIAPGKTLTNAGMFTMSKLGGAGEEFVGGGTFRNTGYFVYNGGYVDVIDATTQFRNAGTFEITDNGNNNTGFLFKSAGTNANFINEAGGLLVKTGTSFGTLMSNDFSGAGAFSNLGVVESRGGVLQWENIPIIQHVGNTLTAGTWHANEGDINFPTTNNTNIAVIGADATVILTGAGDINRIGTGLTTIQGGFFVNNKTFTTGGAGLTLDGGTIGGDGGTITGAVSGVGSISPGNSAGNINLNGNFSLGAGSSYDWELADFLDDGSGIAGDDWDLVTQVSGTGSLSNILVDVSFIDGATDPDSGDSFWDDDHTWLIYNAVGPGQNATNFAGVSNNSFSSGQFSTFLDSSTGDVFLQFSVIAVPEPGAITLWLLLSVFIAVMVGTAQRRR